MEIRQKNLIWNVWMIAFVAVGLSACQKGQSDAEDLETWIVKNYFLPSSDRIIVESSFKLCGTRNKHAIENLEFVYNSKNLNKTVEELNIEGNCVDCMDDPRFNPIVEIIEKWSVEIESGKMNPSKLAYEYAFFQHWLYLKYTEKIQDREIRALYEMAKSNSIDGCLRARISNTTKSEQRPKYPENFKKKRVTSNQDSNARWYLLVFSFLFLFEWKRNFIDIRRVGRFVFGQFKNVGASSSQTQGKYANSASTWEKQNQPEIYTKEQNSEGVKVSLNDLYAPKTNVAPPPPTSKKTPKKKKPKLTKMYARMPAGTTFYEVRSAFEPNVIFFVLNISADDPNTASINLTTDKETREYFLSRERVHQNVCEFRGVENPTVKNVKEVEAGSAKLANDFWTLKSSIKLEWEA